MPRYSVGMCSARDSFALDFDSEPLLERVQRFRNSTLSDQDLCAKLEIPQKKGWNVSKARRDLKSVKNLNEHLVQCSYRPFDYRYCFYHSSVIWGMSHPVMRNFIHHPTRFRNLGFVCMRNSRDKRNDLFFCVNGVTDKGIISSVDNSTVLPLFVFPEELTLRPGGSDLSKPVLNFAPSFLGAITQRLGIRFDAQLYLPSVDSIGPYDIFQYFYALVFSVGFRNRYAEFIRTDFPRVPLTSNIELFRSLANLGRELIGLHLMESNRLVKHVTTLVGKTSEVEKVEYANYTVWIDKAQTSGFKGVPENVWEFHVGGYQVCEKWLKDRKGRKLTKEDIEHYHRIVVALCETIRLMAEIDKVIDEHGGWPIE